MAEPRIKVIPVRMRSAALEVVDTIAKAEGRTRSDVIRRLLSEAIEARRAVKPQRASRHA